MVDLTNAKPEGKDKGLSGSRKKRDGRFYGQSPVNGEAFWPNQTSSIMRDLRLCEVRLPVRVIHNSQRAL